MKREPSFGKNVSLKAGTIEIISDFMNKTKKGFSETLNIIVKQWDQFSIMMMKIERDRQIQTEITKVKEAEVIDPIKEKVTKKKKSTKKVQK